MTLHLEMVVDRKGLTEDGREVEIGTVVTYLGHVVGGMVHVRFSDGTDGVMNPNCFATLRS